MAVELLISPPASGKTESCIQRIKTIQKEHPLAKIRVVVPDRVQAAAFRKRLAIAGGSLGTQVGRFTDLYYSILQKSGNDMPLASSPLLHRLIQEIVNDAVNEGDLPYYQSISGFPGFILALQNSFAELKRAFIDSESFIEITQSGTPAQKDLGTLYQRYLTRLKSLNWADPEDINWLAISSLKNNPICVSDTRLIVVDGFDSFNGAQFQFLKLLSEGANEILITFPGESDSERFAHHRFMDDFIKLKELLAPTISEKNYSIYLPDEIRHIEKHIFNQEIPSVMSVAQPILMETRSPADEVREALRWIKKLVIRKKLPLKSCIIFTPNPSVYHPLLRLYADEFGIPVTFTLDESLEKSPAISALINLLNLPVKNFNSRLLINVLRSPYFEFLMDSEIVDTFEMVSRVAQIVEGRDQWQEAWDRLTSTVDQNWNELDDERNAPKLPRGEDAIKLKHILDAVFQMISPPIQRSSQTSWINWLENLLDNLKFYERTDNERDLSASEMFREVLRSLVSSEVVVGERQVDYQQFLVDLLGTLQGERFRELGISKQPALLVARMTEARGIRFKAVAILGLSEGSFPINERPDPFLNEEIRAELGLEPRLQREQAGLFYQALTRSDQYLLITRPYMSEDGEQWEESIFWTAVKKLFDPSALIKINPDKGLNLTNAASTQELLFEAVRLKSLPQKYDFLLERWQNLQQARDVLKARRSKVPVGHFEGFTETIKREINEKFSPNTVWSASRLETYSTCPFQFYVKTMLELEERILPSLDMDAKQRGSLLHKILEETYKNIPDPDNLTSVIESLKKESRKQFLNAPRTFGFRPSLLWSIEQEQLYGILEQSVTALAEDSTWIPFKYEAKFGIKETLPLEINLNGESILLKGVIDRVDKNASGQLRIIDYKTGGSHLSIKDLVNGLRLQLPIYALAARDALGLGEPMDGMYWKILAAEPGSLKLGKFSNDASSGVQATIDIALSHISRILHNIRSGEFPPAAPEDGCPSYCPAAQWCWRYEPGW
ncbi:MAG: hypothetical protein CL609_15035 [Anaerolineaceae bacterium]|nr:hypothetical protein [Anaerolineaceae bacterium]